MQEGALWGRDLDYLLSSYLAVARRDGGGTTVFVAGEMGSGRTPLLRAFADELSNVDPRPNLVAGGFANGAYVSWSSSPGSERSALAVLEDVVTVTAPLLPLTGLFGQLLSTSRAAERLLRRMAGQGDRRDPQELLPLVFDSLCENGPSVCIIDDSDRSAINGWWADLVLDLAPHIRQGLPLLLVLAVEGPSELGDHASDESDSLAAARLLTRRGLAEWHPLVALDPARLAESIGPATREVVESLLKSTGGRAEWASELWQDWREGNVVERDPDGRWHFSSEGLAATRGPVRRLVADRLKQLLPGADLQQLDAAREVLACGALAGEQFAAQAVAEALDFDTDDVIDLLDDSLSVNGSAPHGFVTETGSVAIADEGGERHLWLYSFESRLDWLTLLHHGFTDGELPEVSLRLAESVADLYGSEQHHVALALARLLNAAGETELASRYRRMHDISVNREIVLWRARRALTRPDPDAPAQRRRVSQLLIAAGEIVLNRGPFDEGLAFATAAQRLAPLRTDQAHALFQSARFRHALGDSTGATREVNAALTLSTELGSQGGQATALHLLGLIETQQRAYATARDTLRRALEIEEKISDIDGTINTRRALAAIDIEQGEYERARSQLETLMQLHLSRNDSDGKADVIRHLASLDIKQGRYAQAQDRLHHAIRLERSLGNQRAEADARHHLAVIDFRQGDIDKARREFEAVFAVYHQLADRRGEAEMRRELATIEIQLRNFDIARIQLNEVLAIMESLDDPDGVADTIGQLAVIDHREGAYERAHAGFVRALEIHIQLGDRDGEITARRELAATEITLGRFEEARSELDQALALAEKLQAPHHLATVLATLGVVDYREGSYQSARSRLLRVVELRRALDDQHGEAAARHELATIDIASGNRQRATEEVERVVELRRELGDDEGIAAALRLLDG